MLRERADAEDKVTTIEKLERELADDVDFFVEQVFAVAIVFDNTDDVTVWATTDFDHEPHFFHLALPFQSLDTLLRLTAERMAGRRHRIATVIVERVAPADREMMHHADSGSAHE